MTNKILCPVDFSPGSGAAIRVAARLANDTTAELVIAHSWYLPPSAYSEFTYPAELAQTMRDDAQHGLDLAVRDAQAAGASVVSSRLLHGIPWLVIAETAEDPDVQLVVIGTHGRTGVSRFLLGSVAEKVVRHAPCSVMVVQPDSEPKALEHVLCPLDFSDSSRDAMHIAGALARRTGATVTLLHAVEVPSTWAPEVPLFDYAREFTARAARLLDTWAAELKASADIPVTTQTRVGSPAGETLALLDADPSFDLVVMGTHGRTGLKRALLGSVAEKVVRHARCPVLVARKRG